MGVYEIDNLINLTLPRQRNLQFLKTAFILNGVQPGEAHVYPIFFIMHGFNTKEKSTIGKTSWKLPKRKTKKNKKKKKKKKNKNMKKKKKNEDVTKDEGPMANN